MVTPYFYVLFVFLIIRWFCMQEIRKIKSQLQLHSYLLKQSNRCNFCESIDTLEHHLYQCFESKKIWDKLESWLFNHIKIKLNLKECEILFGIPNATNEYLELINFMIIITKWYINAQRSNEKPLYFFELLNVTRTKVKTLNLANSMNNRTNRPWQDLLDDIL